MKTIIRLIILSSIVGLMVNCSPTPFESRKFPGLSSLCSGICFQEFNSPFSLMTASQTYQSMLNVTGLNGAAVGRTEFTARSGALSESDSLNAVNGPLLLGATSIAGEICGDRADAEAGAAAESRRLFSDLNFAQTIAQNGTAKFQASAARLASVFLARNIRPEESTLVAQFVEEFKNGAASDSTAQTKGLAIGLCTAMLSSFDAITY